MFTDRPEGKKCGRPRFKPRRKYKSFTLLQAGWKLLPGNRIKIGKRIYRYFKSRDIEGTPKRCTIKRDAVKWRASERTSTGNWHTGSLTRMTRYGLRP